MELSREISIARPDVSYCAAPGAAFFIVSTEDQDRSPADPDIVALAGITKPGLGA
jgi:hypothetical protein